jgi:hypothetical protein
MIIGGSHFGFIILVAAALRTVHRLWGHTRPPNFIWREVDFSSSSINPSLRALVLHVEMGSRTPENEGRNGGSMYNLGLSAASPRGLINAYV